MKKLLLAGSTGCSHVMFWFLAVCSSCVWTWMWYCVCLHIDESVACVSTVACVSGWCSDGIFVVPPNVFSCVMRPVGVGDWVFRQSLSNLRRTSGVLAELEFLATGGITCGERRVQMTGQDTANVVWHSGKSAPTRLLVSRCALLR